MANSVIQTIRDAEVDARSLSEFVSKDAYFTVTRRLAPTIHTLDYYLLVLSKVKDKGDLADMAISDTLDKLEQLEPTVIQRVEDAINNTAIEGGVLADTFVVVDGSLSQRTINKGLESIADLSTINNPKDGLRVYVKSYHAGIDGGGGEFVYDADMPKSKHNGGTIIDPDKVYPSNWADLTQKNTWFTSDASNTGTGCYKRIMTDTVSSEFFGTIQKTDATVELNSFFGFIRATVLSENYTWVKNITITGSFNVSDTIKCDFRNMTVAYWNLELIATAPLKIIMALSCQQATMFGFLSVKSGVFDPITGESLCDVGIAVQRCIGSEYPVIRVDGCRSWGVLVETTSQLDSIGNNTGASFFNNSQANFPRITTSNCGRKDKRVFRSKAGISGFSSAVSSITQVGSSASQYSELSVGTLPPDVVGGSILTTYVTINKKPYQLRSIDELTNKIQVFPIVPTEDLSTDIVHYHVGGGVLFAGTDSNVITVNYIDVYESIKGVIDHSFYGANLNQYTTHNSIISYAVGSKATDISPMAALCQSIYTENNLIDLVHTGVGSLHIGSTKGGFSFSKCYALNVQNTRGVGNEGFKNVTFGTAHDSTFYSGKALNENNGYLTCKPLDGYALTYYTTAIHLRITAPDAAQNRLFGSQTMQVTCIGKNTSDGALATPITVSPASIGDWTVNGGVETYTIPQAIGKPSLITIVWDWTTKNVKIFVS